MGKATNPMRGLAAFELKEAVNTVLARVDAGFMYALQFEELVSLAAFLAAWAMLVVICF